MEENNNCYWYILIIRGGKEEKIQEELANSALKERVKKIEIPLNPASKKKILKNYLLLYCNLDAELVNFFYSLSDMVIGFMGHDKKKNELPTKVSEKLIQNFLKKVEKIEIYSEEKKEEQEVDVGTRKNEDFFEGNLIRVVKGQFKGYKGKIVYLNEGKKKIKIVLSELGWEIDNIPFEDCQKI